MKQYNAAHFRRNMSKTLDQCEESCEPVLITTRKDGRDQPQQMIVISKAQYEMMVNKINRDK
jgi:PHD/YefM family antitoxin component YafN of YafNO toxin-antitoxin module